jgi:hypothetical protein
MINSGPTDNPHLVGVDSPFIAFVSICGFGGKQREPGVKSSCDEHRQDEAFSTTPKWEGFAASHRDRYVANADGRAQ